MTRRALVVIVAALLTVPATAAAVPIKNESIGIWHPDTRAQLINRLAEGTTTDISEMFGDPSDIPVAGDWDGDGRDGIGVYRPSTGEWYLRNRAGSGVWDIHLNYGISVDKPFVGDFNGDGRDDIGVFRAIGTQTAWFIHLSPANGEMNPATQISVLNWGVGTDMPIAGDWDGNGIDGIGIFRRSTGTGQWFLLNNPSGQNAPFPDIYATYKGESSSDQPIAGDWDGDGKDSLGVFRAPSNASSTWYLENAMSNGSIGALTTDIQFSYWGSSGDKAIAGDWDGRRPECRDGIDNDGDGWTDWAGQDVGCWNAYDTPEDFPLPIWTSTAEQSTYTEWKNYCVGTGGAATPPVTEADVGPQTGGRIKQDTVHAQGQRSYRIEVRDGDTCGGSGGSERAELAQDNGPSRPGFENSLFNVGDDRWISWQVYLPAGFPSDKPNNPNWQFIAQWHQRDGGGPPLAMAVNDNKFTLYRSSTNYDDNPVRAPIGNGWPVVKGRWVRFTMHVKFSPDPAVGFVELYGDLATPGQMTTLMDRTQGAGWTMVKKRSDGSTPPVHPRIGIYRNSGIDGTSYLYYDGYSVAASRYISEAQAFGP